MAERTTVTELVQIGIESTAGTAVAATKQLTSLGLVGSPKMNFDKFRPAGSKFNTLTAMGKEWTEAKITGEPCYTELHYMLASVLQYTAPVQIGATTAYTWSHLPSSTAPDTVKTYTVEKGSSVRAEKWAYGIVSDLTLSGDRDNIDLSGMMMGRAMSEGITMTSGGITSPALIPILPQEVSIYANDTSGALGTTKLERVLKWSWSISGRFNPLWVVDAAQTSWVAHVEGPVTAQLKLTLENDPIGSAYRTTARTSATKFIRIEAVSSQNAGTATPYKLTFDAAAKVSETGEASDEDGIQAYELTFDIVHDATWGKALTAVLINSATAL